MEDWTAGKVTDTRRVAKNDDLEKHLIDAVRAIPARQIVEVASDMANECCTRARQALSGDQIKQWQPVKAEGIARWNDPKKSRIARFSAFLCSTASTSQIWMRYGQRLRSPITGRAMWSTRILAFFWNECVLSIWRLVGIGWNSKYVISYDHP